MNSQSQKDVNGKQALNGFSLSDDAMPKAVGRYKIFKVLGRGGMGVVFLGKDPYIERKVAVKISKPTRFLIISAFKEFCDHSGGSDPEESQADSIAD